MDDPGPSCHAGRMQGAHRLGPPVAGILLTGGTSRRMGFDKASIRIGGVPCAARVAKVLRAVVAHAVEVGPGTSGLPAVREEPPGGGPLVAVCAGARVLEESGSTRPALVVACDLPLVTESVLRTLADWPGSRSVVPMIGGRPQPLCARWSARGPGSGGRPGRGRDAVHAVAPRPTRRGAGHRGPLAGRGGPACVHRRGHTRGPGKTRPGLGHADPLWTRLSPTRSGGTATDDLCR